MKASLLAPLETIYGAGLRAKNNCYDRHAPQRLTWPVVSVGNLSVGGAGKTPLVILLAGLLAREGFNVDVLSRGYGRSGRGIERVDAAGDPRHFGDEPMMIARAAKVPVFVGASRYQAGLLAERQLAGATRRVHLLDDGFQHRQLQRAADIVAVHRDDLEGRLLPAGRLREPLGSLRRADIIVLREEDGDLEDRLTPYLKPGASIWRVRRRLTFTENAILSPQPAVAFCAIARPEEFFRMLQAAGITVAAAKAFRDHHGYRRGDMETLRKLARDCGAASFTTTEKDAVKLSADLREILSAAAPLHVAGLTLELTDESAAMARLAATLH